MRRRMGNSFPGEPPDKAGLGRIVDEAGPTRITATAEAAAATAFGSSTGHGGGSVASTFVRLRSLVNSACVRTRAR